ncbi:MAG: glycosyl hydrolase 108 family protein [Campylobacter sp.]
MADFTKSYEKMLNLEFSGALNALHHNKTESGLTWMGIYEKAHPNWQGWEKIKQILNQTNDIKKSSEILFKDEDLKQKTKIFYEQNFWDKIKGDEIKSQKIADEIFIFAVNAGLSVAVKMAQKIVGVNADGVVGEATIKALNSYDESKFDAEFDRAEMEHYGKLIAKNPHLSIYENGWRRRANEV